MCGPTIDWYGIDLNHVLMQLEAHVEAFYNSTLYLSGIPPQSNFAAVILGDFTPAEEAIVACLFNATGRARSAFWDGRISALNSFHLKLKIVQKDLVDSNAQTSEPDIAGTVTISFDREAIILKAKAFDVTYPEAFAETIIHETMHAYHGDHPGDEEYHGKVIETEDFRNNVVVTDAETAYQEVFADNPPYPSYYDNLPGLPPVNQIPIYCINGVLGTHSESLSIMENVVNARKYEYPSYTISWRYQN